MGGVVEAQLALAAWATRTNALPWSPRLQLWLGGGGGNANFLYGMNLLWGGLQTVLLLQLLRAAAWQEAKREERAADGEGGAGAAEEPGSGAASDGDAKQA